MTVMMIVMTTEDDGNHNHRGDRSSISGGWRLFFTSNLFRLLGRRVQDDIDHCLCCCLCHHRVRTLNTRLAESMATFRKQQKDRHRAKMVKKHGRKKMPAAFTVVGYQKRVAYDKMQERIANSNAVATLEDPEAPALSPR